MSFEIHYCKAAGKPFGARELEAFCAWVGHYKMAYDSNAEQARYEHPDTGVHFAFSPAHAPEGAQRAAGGEWTGYRCVIPTPRATVYGAEIVPIALMLAQKFDLQVWYSGQDGPAGRPDQNQLMQAWLAANQAAQDGPDAPPMLQWQHETMATWYTYSLMRADLEKKLIDGGHDVDVPRIELVRGGEGIQRVVELKQGRGTVIPPVDLIRVTREKKALFGLSTKQETGLATYDDATRALRDSLQALPVEAGTVLLLGDRVADKLADRFAMLPLQAEAAPLPRVTVDEFVDC